MSRPQNPAPVAGQKWSLLQLLSGDSPFHTLLGTYTGSEDRAGDPPPALGNLSLHYWRLEPDATGKVADDQTPHKEDEAYFVLQGGGEIELSVSESAREAIPLAVGDLIFVPRGVRHRFTRAAPEGLHLLVIFSPDFSG